MKSRAVLPGVELEPLEREFYSRPVVEVSKDCIGKVLVSTENDQLLVARIVETEAYRGPEDRASHAFGGRRTARTEVVFGPAGYAYVFLIYGLHYHFNIVTGQAEQPEAVLIRGLEPVIGHALMARRRKLPETRKELTNGPGKLAQAFGITLAHYGADLTRGQLFLADGKRGKICSSTRIGVDYAGAWANKPWRFYESGNRYVSPFRKPKR